MEIPTADPRFHGSQVCILENSRPNAARPLGQTWIPLLPARIGALGSQDRSASEASIEISAAEVSSLEAAAQPVGIHLQEFLQAGFAALLARLTRQEMIDIAAAEAPPVRIDFRCEEISSVASMAHSRTAERIDIEGNGFDAAWAVGFEYSDRSVPSPWLRKCCLSLSICAQPVGLRVTLLSASGLWSNETLGRWLVYLRNLWLGVATATEQAIWGLPLVPESELPPAYRQLNDTTMAFGDAATVHQIFAECARQTPDALAVSCGTKQYTYRDLDQRSTTLALQLISLGAGAGKPVAVCMERSTDLPMALLAVLKSGSCYVPLDPRDPARRLSAILEECRPVAVISDMATAPLLRLDIPVLSVDEIRPVQENSPALPTVDPDSAAYIIYTSGTTGRPKGVMIPHRGLRNTLCAVRDLMRFGAADRLLAVFTVSFDAATMELLMPLISGGSVRVAGPLTAGDPVGLIELLEQHDITVLSLTPVSWRMLVDSGWKGKTNLKMISGGEALSRGLANRLLDRGAELWNSYGPTETSICCSHVRVKREVEDVPIGPPIANLRFYVADTTGSPLPEDVPGELWIGGAGVGLGYLGNPDLTADRFIPDPFHAGEGIYRSGDLVRLCGGKELQFLGRVDSQVKLRGFRIELGEVESVLQSHPAVRDAVALLRNDEAGEPALVAFATTDSPGVSEADLRKYAGEFLADYLLPKRIGVLKEMPLSPNGKVDRNRLPSLEGGANIALGVQPDNDLERKLLRIFHSILGEPSMGVTDSFFDFGGYSLLIVRLFARINRDLDLNLPISVIFEAPTVRGLADYIRNGTHPSLVVPIRPGGNGTPLFIIHSYLIYEALSKAVGRERPLYGVRERDEDGAEILFESRADLYAQAIAAHYPEGPVHLAGWCAAAMLTVEVARRLDEIYGRNGLVILIDGEAPGFFDSRTENRSFLTRVRSWLRYHRERFWSVPPSEKADYLGNIVYHSWEGLLYRFSSRHPRFARWLHRRFPSAVPLVVGGDAAVASVMATQTELQPYNGGILLLRASEDQGAPEIEETLGWNTIARRGTNVVFVPGDHISMFREPQLGALGHQLDLAFAAFESARRMLPKSVLL
jgi:amino acid adenylation domain-containing protein